MVIILIIHHTTSVCFKYIYVYIYICACEFVYICTCLCACTSLCTWVRTYLRIYLFIYKSLSTESPAYCVKWSNNKQTVYYLVLNCPLSEDDIEASRARSRGAWRAVSRGHGLCYDTMRFNYSWTKRVTPGNGPCSPTDNTGSHCSFVTDVVIVTWPSSHISRESARFRPRPQKPEHAVGACAVNLQAGSASKIIIRDSDCMRQSRVWGSVINVRESVCVTGLYV